MSKFKLTVEFPTWNSSWISRNTLGFPKCISEWRLDYGSDEYTSLLEDDNGVFVVLHIEDSLTIPFKAKSLDKVNVSEFNIRYKQQDIASDSYITIETYEGNQFPKAITGAGLQDIQLSSSELENAKYIKIINDYVGTNNIDIHLDGTEFKFETNEFDINPNKNNLSMNMNLRTSKTIDYKNYVTKVKETEVNYMDFVKLFPTQIDEIKQIGSIASLNNLITYMDININDIAIKTLGNIGAGGAENWKRFFFRYIDVTQKSGLYSYVDIYYKQDPNNKQYI